MWRIASILRGKIIANYSKDFIKNVEAIVSVLPADVTLSIVAQATKSGLLKISRTLPDGSASLIAQLPVLAGVASPPFEFKPFDQATRVSFLSAESGSLRLSVLPSGEAARSRVNIVTSGSSGGGGSGGGLTNTELRASAVPTSISSLPLPSGAATESTLALIKAKTDNIDVALSTRAVTGLTDTQLRAASVPVSGPLTDAQLRVTAVLISGPVTDTQLRASPVPISGPLTDAQMRATAVPVSGPLTDTQLRTAAVPVSGPLTDTQLRAAAVPVSLPAGLATSANQTTEIAGLASIDGHIDGIEGALDVALSTRGTEATLATRASEATLLARASELTAAAILAKLDLRLAAQVYSPTAGLFSNNMLSWGTGRSYLQGWR